MNNFDRNRKRVSIGFYWRKFFFFVGFFALSLVTIRSFTQFKADSSANIPTVSADSNYTTEIKIEKTGRIIINGQRTTQNVAILQDYDELRLPIIDQPKSDISFAKFILILPSDNASQVNRQILGIHGVGQTTSYIQDGHTIIYQAQDISTYGTVSIIAQLPKGTITPPLGRVILDFIPKLGGYWVVLGLSLPLLTFLFMLFFVITRATARDKKDIKSTEAPPMAIPPGVVGVLYRQKVGPREIAATLIDLAKRGDIIIIDRSRDFAFAKNKLDKRLLGYEKLLLSKIFRNHITTDRSLIEQSVNDNIYSRKISVLSLGIYNLATRLGYYSDNPQKVYLKYKIWGGSIFMLGLVGFVYSLIKFSNTTFLPFLWLGMMLAAFVITWMSQKISVRTKLGDEAYLNWLGFRQYLSEKKKIPYSPENQELFQKYLPYAIVLECEIDWAQRFSEHNFVIPDWFITEKGALGLEDFCLSLFPIISYVSRSFAAIREPGFR